MPGKGKRKERKSEERKETGSLEFMILSTTYDENVERNEERRKKKRMRGIALLRIFEFC